MVRQKKKKKRIAVTMLVLLIVAAQGSCEPDWFPALKWFCHKSCVRNTYGALFGSWLQPPFKYPSMLCTVEGNIYSLLLTLCKDVNTCHQQQSWMRLQERKPVDYLFTTLWSKSFIGGVKVPCPFSFSISIFSRPPPPFSPSFRTHHTYCKSETETRMYPAFTDKLTPF